jgi:phytoene dehydrogenase-like protein
MSNDQPGAQRTIIIGAGVSGLTCAALLHDAGQAVTLLEASDGAGGRLRTDRHPDGFLLDRGFQVILGAYPALQRQVDLASLNLKPFDAGVLLWTGRRRVPLADPRRHPFAIARDITTRVFPVSDKARLASFAAGSRLASWESAREAALTADVSGEQALITAGLSDRFIDRFARPFWGGITLDRSLQSSAGPLKFTLKMLLQGSAVLPAAGVQAVPAQIARRLPATAIELDRRVDSIEIEDGRVRGVVVSGERIGAGRVVVATDPPAARTLTGIEAVPTEGVGCVTVYLRGSRDPRIGKKLVLDATGNRGINHIVPLSAVAPSYAPPGEHLLAVVFVGQEALGEQDDEKLVRAARDDVALILGHEPENWAMVHVARTPFAQFAQPPGIFRQLPKVRTDTAGLYLAGEMIVDSSLNGAIIGGERAAKAVLEDLAGASG